MTKEEKFLNALKNIFIGAPVEGESGYINLMRIKARYFERGVFPQLMQDIEATLQPFPEFREELFDKLYAFFHRYFSESGSIYFRYTPLHQNVYERVYTDDRDVMLFWKTHMLYYVKTDRLFQNMEVEVDGQRFFFDVSTLEHKKANEKRALVFDFKEKRGDGVLVFTMTYSERGRQTKMDDIRRALRKAGVNLDEETLERAFNLFERQSEVDYFINKNARAFLREQFDLWMYQYVFSGESQWTEKRIRQLQTLKDIAYKIIDFIAQFEDELVRIWNKPKFVLNANYVITLDRIASRDGGMELIERLLAHPNFSNQLQEWRDLGMVGENFKPQDVWQEDLMGKRVHERYQHLPIDTRYFKDLEWDILALFDNLDRQLDGWLIKSENYQALNTLLPKFRERVKCIYIDPPYNTGSDEFIYRDQFRHSSWLTMMENRLRLSREWLGEGGVMFMSNDDNEQSAIKGALDLVFGGENFVTQVIWQKKYSPQNDAKYFSDNHDYITVFAKQKEKWNRNLLPRTEEANARYTNPDNDARGPWKPSGLDVKTYTPAYDYPITIPSGRTVHPPRGRCWAVPKTRLEELIRDNRIWFGPDGNSVPAMKRFLSEVQQGIVPLTIWTYEEVGHNQEAKQEIKAIIADLSDVFQTPKPVRLLARVFQIGANADSLIFDFFAGSGSTAHAVINLNRADGGKRKYILIEMADYFDTVLLPRIKKVVFSDKWKDGKAQNGQGISHFVKYYHLEQYEDVLRRAHYEDADLFSYQKDPYSQYVFLRDLKMLEAVEVDTEKEEVRVSLNRLYASIDLAETLSCLTGKWIRRITADTVEFEDGERVDLTNPPWERVKPLIWW